MKGESGLKGKIAFVTGGSSGIGLSTAKLLSERGVKVIIASRDEDKLKRAVKKINPAPEYMVMDLSKISSVESGVSSFLKENDPPDILVNCAGISHPGHFDELSIDVIEETIETNLMGTILITRLFYPHMKSGSSIVNVGSFAGFMGLYGYTAYSASKFGITGFSEALRMELKKKGINVSLILPSDTMTPQLERENLTKPKELKKVSSTIKPIDPEKVAESIIRVIVTGKFLVIPTFSGKLTYLIYRLFPRLTRRYLDMKID